MYPILLALHSWVRWLVLAVLLYAVYRAYNGWSTKRTFTKLDKRVRLGAVLLVHTQLIIGVWLYFVSPNIRYFMDHFKEAVHQSDIRFFAMEHGIMMLIAIVIITIGSARSRRKSSDLLKFKTMAVWFTIGLVLILIFIPWPFSPFAARPLFRPF